VENAWIAAIGYALVWAIDEEPRRSMREGAQACAWSWHYEYRDRVLDNLTTAQTSCDPGMRGQFSDQRMSELFDEAIDHANLVLVKQERDFRFRRTRNRSCYVAASDLLACNCSQAQASPRIRALRKRSGTSAARPYLQLHRYLLQGANRDGPRAYRGRRKPFACYRQRTDGSARCSRTTPRLTCTNPLHCKPRIARGVEVLLQDPPNHGPLGSLRTLLQAYAGAGKLQLPLTKGNRSRVREALHGFAVVA
jgi:hypothetical protein